MPSDTAKLLTPGDAAYLAAVHAAMDIDPPTDPAIPAAQVALMLEPGTPEGPRLGLVTACLDGATPTAAAVALVSAGRAALVMIGSSGGADRIAAVLRTQAAAAWSQGLKLLEILVVPGSSTRTVAFKRAGYRRLTTLIYLRGRADTAPGHPANPDLEWHSFSSQTEPWFERAIERSYEQSLDCPELSSLRSVSEALAGHRAAGVFDPALWWLGLLDGEPAGVILLSRMQSDTGLELVYMGTSPHARGRGVGDALLERGFHCARQRGVTTVALAVDARNTHARRLYGRWGFTEVGVRDAWIASPPDSER